MGEVEQSGEILATGTRNGYPEPMPNSGPTLATSRLLLRHWHPSDLEPFAKMHTDPEVMADLGGPISTEDSAQKFLRYCEGQRCDGYSRWCVEDHSGRFVGYVGVVARQSDHPFGQHDEIGWRFNRQFWGQGLATEAARAALDDAFLRLRLGEVFCHALRENRRSQAVIAKLPFVRRADLDFLWPNDGKPPHDMLVWKAENTSPL